MELVLPVLIASSVVGFAVYRAVWGLRRDGAAAARVDAFYTKYEASLKTLATPGGGELQVLDVGRDHAGALDKPALLFIHGACARMGQFAVQIDHFVDRGYHVVAFDAIGCGRSAKPDEPARYHPDQFVSDAAHVLMRLFGEDAGGAPERRVVQVAHSFGTYVALRNASHPLVAGSVLLGANPLWLDDDLPRKLGVFHLPNAVLWALRPLFGKSFQKMALAPCACGDLRATEAEASRRNPVYMFAHFYRTLPAVRAAPHPAPPSDHPLLFVSGRHDKITPPAHTVSYVEGALHAHTRVRHVVVEDAAHQMMQESAGVVVGEIEAYLATLR